MKSKILFLAVVFVFSGFCSNGAGAADFADRQYNYYDIHNQRLEYIKEYKENRLKMDNRRNDYLAPMQKALSKQLEEWSNDDLEIDYKAGQAKVQE